MAITYTDNGGGAPNGSKLEFTFTFPVIQTEDTKVALNAVVQATTKYTVDLSSNPTKITFNSNNIDPTVQESTGAPKTGVTVRVFRQTEVGKSTGDDAPKAVYAAGSSIRAGDLNANTEQALYAIHELQDQPLTDEFIEDGSITSAKIKDGTIVNVDVSATAAIDGTKVDPNFGSQNIATTGTINNLTTTELAILDGATVSTTELNKLDGVTATTNELNILDGVTATTTELNYVDGVTSNIQTQIDAKQNTDPELVELSTMSSGTASALADLTQTEVQILDGATVSTTELNKLDGVTSTTAELNILDGVTATASELNILDGVTATASEINKLDGVTASTAELNILDGVTATATELNIIDGVTATTAELNYVDGVTSNVQTQLNAKQPLDAELTELATMASDTASSLADLTAAEVQTLDGVTATTDEINKLDGVTTSTTELNYVDGVTSNIQTQINDKQASSARLTTLSGIQSGTASKLADNTALTADLADLNQLDGMTKQTTITNDDTKFPTSGAIVDYVAAQLAPIGGFEVVATDAAFPNTQPASGVVISIADGGGLVVNGSGTSTTGRTVGGSTVTINNFASNFNNTTVDPGVAILVSSTGSGNVYNYHKATLKEADLLSLSGDINDFAERYRVVASEPNTGNDEGDLIYDKSVDKIKVFDSTTNSFKLVDSVGEFKFLFLCPTGSSGTPTLNGSINTYDLREGSSSGTLATVSSAAQLLVSIDGVIQKPNTGTSQPSEGFAMVDTNTIVFGSNLVADTQVFIIQIGAEVNIGVPGDNQVSTEKLQNLAVTTNKIADQAVTLDKLPHGTSSNNGKFLRANNGADPTFETISIPAAVGGSDGVDFNDNIKARFGTGNDLSIYHDGNGSYLLHNGTGFFLIEGNGSSNLNIRAKSGENSIICIPDGAVELYYDGSKKLETNSLGIKFTGTLQGIDNHGILLGTSSDFRIRHTGSHSEITDEGTGNLRLGSNTTIIGDATFSETQAKFTQNGAVELYHDNVKKLETTSSGVTVSGNLTTGNLNAATDGNTSISLQDTGHGFAASEIKLSNGGRDLNITSPKDIRLFPQSNETAIVCEANGQVELYYDNVKKLETTSNGISVDGHISLADNKELRLGSADEVKITHTGSSTNFNVSQHYLNFYANGTFFYNQAGSETKASLLQNGAATLYYDGSKKFETTSGGVDVTGVLTVNGATVTTGGLGNVVEDSTPQLGGDLDFNGNNALLQGAGSNVNTNWDNDAWEKIVFDNSYNVNAQGPNKIVLHNDTNWKAGFGVAADEVGMYTGGNIAFYGNTTDSTASIKEGLANFKSDGSVDLYYDGSKKFETTSGGAKITGNLELISHLYMGDSDKVLLGNAQDFQMYHDGTTSRIHSVSHPISIRSGGQFGVFSGGGEAMLTAQPDGAAELYYDNSKKFETTSSGITVSGDAVINSARVGNWQVNSSYKGLFHNNHSANEYMIISADSATYVSATTGNPVYIRYGNNDTTNQLIIGSGNDALTWRGNKVFHAGNDGSGSGLDADTLDGVSSGSFVRSDASDTMSGNYNLNGRLDIGNGTNGEHEIRIYKADNNVADHIQFYNGTTRVGEIGTSDSSWLRINQSTAKNIYTPRYIRADNGFFVDGSSKGINGSGNFVGGTIAGASDYGTLIRSNTDDNVTGHTEWQDNYQVRLGNSSDLKLYHNGSNSYIVNATGNLYINATSSETGIQINPNADVRLRYNNSNKLYTTSYGMSVGSAGGSVFSGLSNYQAYVGFDTHSSSGFAGVVMGSGPNGNSPFVGASKGGNGSANSFSLYTNGTRRMQIHGSNGNIGAPTAGNNIYNASDERLKENMVELTDGLSKINQIKPYSFTWKSGFDESLEGVTQYGFGAHQTKSVDEILVEPFGVGDIELPNETIENPLRVNEKFIIPMLVKAVQELSAKVETLETKVAALEVK